MSLLLVNRYDLVGEKYETGRHPEEACRFLKKRQVDEGSRFPRSRKF